MTPSRPYLLRAFYDWIVDNHFTPYVVINSEMDNVKIPRQFVEEGRIVLNISPEAIRSLLMANDHIEFCARFSGVPYEIYAPIKAVSAIYAKENGRGMVFKEEDEDESPPDPNGSSGEGEGEGKSSSGKPKLTLVK